MSGTDVSGRRRWGWRALQLVYAVCLLGLLLLPAQRYGWMRELDPGMAGSLPEDGSGNRVIAVNLMLGGAIAAQLFSAWLAATRRGRWAAATLALVALVLWALRFGAS
jgi:hypothetical protein